MADIQHVNIQDPEIHEPRGATSAAANSVYVANGAGSGAWTAVDYPAVSTPVVAGRSYIDQNPTGVNTPLQITFGAEQITTDITLSSAGGFTINTAGTYEVVFVFRLSRTTATGTALLGLRWLRNGVTEGGPTAIRMPDDGYSFPFSFSIMADFAVNDVVTAEIIRDSTGVDNGGLQTVTFVAAGWGPAASAVAIFNKLEAGL